MSKINEKIDILISEVNKLKESKTVSMTVDEYNKELNSSKKNGMVFIINVVLDVINNDGKNIKNDNEELEKFINTVKDAIKGDKNE